jgi:type IV secretory pathway TraG/TraD family ATPase VirD4
MSEKWGRAGSAGTWPSTKAISTLAVLMLAIVSGMAISAYRYRAVWTPLQRFYLFTYLRSEFLDALTIKTGRFQLLNVIGRTDRPRLAFDDEVQPQTTTHERTFTLSKAGREVGDRQLVWEDGMYPNATLHALLKTAIYRDQTLTDLAMPFVWGTLGVFGLGLLVAVPHDIARARARRHGVRTKGPELVTARQFTPRQHADGIEFPQERTALARLLGLHPSVRLPRAIESSHFLIIGDSGTGKSTLIRQILTQLAARGDAAIVYDPAREYTPQFYNPERGDLILNPLDARCPYWSPGDEVRHDAEALTVATSLFPDRPHENTFFIEGPRRIFAHLLTFRPTAEQLTAWLCHPEELDRRVRGTSYAAIIDSTAPAQRSGVLASLNMVADTLQLLPRESETSRRWSATAWASSRTEWLFLTSSPETRTRLIPLTSLWLDLLVLRLMTLNQEKSRRVWFILDELASLQRLPQLHTAITENRKSNNPVVLGFQGRSQLETRYGHDAEAMLSQPATKIFLRTSEPRAAAWIAETLGKVEIERLRESRSQGHKSYTLERQEELLVLASEIMGLANLRGYLKLENFVTRLHVPVMNLLNRHRGFIERPIPSVQSAEVPTTAPVDPSEMPARRMSPRQRGEEHERLSSGSGHGQTPLSE